MNISEIVKLETVLKRFEDGLTQIESSQNNFFPISITDIREGIDECHTILKKEEDRIVRRRALRKVNRTINKNK